MKKLCIVIPCYNEEEVLPITSAIFLDKLNSLISNKKISEESKIMFVNDGSKDSTWNIIKNLSEENNKFIGLSLSRNRGHQNALLGGLMEAKNNFDVTISIDCDGQDDINAMDKMIDEYLNGFEIVYGVRSKRETDTFFKRFSAETFYKLLNKLGAESVYNHADYRLISSRVLDEFKNFKEVNIFLRGMIPMVGFKSTSVYYERFERIAGESHYPLSKMLALAFEGITSLSVKPIRFITYLGVCISFLSFVLLIYTLTRYFMGEVVEGWSSIFIALCFFNGVQIISIGLIGEYIGKIYLETKGRPRYIIGERTWNPKDVE